MKSYTFWNNKGGTGKTSLCFQCVLEYAIKHNDERVLVVDLCPQANLSEFLLGGMENNGASNLSSLYDSNPRRSIGGYFESRMQSPFAYSTTINPLDYISSPHQMNANIPSNVDLIAGDRLVELQSSFISSLTANKIPSVNTYITVVSWLRDLFQHLEDYDVVFIDTNPSFSIYTQIALAATERLVVPVMADDSSKRALSNVLSLVYGYNLPSKIYAQYTFNTELTNAGMVLPQIHLIVKNRITQYMGTAAAYRGVLVSIDNEINTMMAVNRQYFTGNNVIMEVRDFQSSGVAAFAEAKSFRQLQDDRRVRIIGGEQVQLDINQIRNNLNSISAIVDRL